MEPYFQELVNRPVEKHGELQRWLRDWDELSDAIGEYTAWSFIKFTSRTNDAEAQQMYALVTNKILPLVQTYENKLQKKFIDAAALDGLNQDDFYPAIRKLKKGLEIYREDNLALFSKEQMLSAEYNQVRSAQLIEYKGEDIALDKTAMLLRSRNREVRREVFDKIAERRLQDADNMDRLLTELINVRHQIATNAGYSNYMDYKFADWGRFDYTPADCARFHEVIAETVIPVEAKMQRSRMKFLGLEKLEPYDMMVELTDRPTLKPAENSDDLVEKTILCFDRLDPYFGEGLRLLRDMKHLDLEARPEKIKGVGYNATLPESGVPFIMQNYNGVERDRLVLIHEGGHAIHDLLVANLPYSMLKLHPQLEIAEVASKAMELMSIKHWDIYYPNKEDARAAEVIKLGSIISYLLFYSLGDCFEMWLYKHPQHTVEERRDKWMELTKRLGTGLVDYGNYEALRRIDYQDISPVYILPFYLVAYSFSDLAAISLWRNFIKDPAAAIEKYKTALSLGNKRTVPELYKAAGVEFNFSKPYVKELMNFVEKEINP